MINDELMMMMMKTSDRDMTMSQYTLSVSVNVFMVANCGMLLRPAGVSEHPFNLTSQPTDQPKL